MNLLKGLNAEVLCNEPLYKHTTFKIGGPCDIFCMPKDVESIAYAVQFAAQERCPVFILGGGSNVLVSDEGFRGMVLSLRHSDSFNAVSKNISGISCGSGRNLQGMVLRSIEDGFEGLEFLAGIPGTLGGAIRMNSGSGKGGPWIADYIDWIKVLLKDGSIAVLRKEDIQPRYRTANIVNSIILEAGFKLDRSKDKAGSMARYNAFLDRKKSSQDLSRPSAGCAFKNPDDPDIPAGRLIELSGMKGFAVGDAAVSEIHCNFIVNLGRATCRDVCGLMDAVKDRVFKDHGVLLEPEIEVI
ncbi:MAG: UDP-N-acetylmuramate dehydrogenase [Candidatus Omnitrophota bacterium]